MHPSDGILRAWQDEALSPSEQAEVAGHLATCPACQNRAESLHARTARVAARMAALAPATHEAIPPSASVYPRLQARFTDSKEETATMWSTFIRRYRPLVAGLAALLVLAMMMAFPPVRAAAADFLGLFRVQRIAVIPLDPANLSGDLESSTQLERLLSDDVQVETFGEAREAATVKEASELAAIPVRLPEAVKDAPSTITVQPGTKITLKVDLPRVRTLLTEVGRSDIVLPDSLNGATVTAELPSVVETTFGEGCGFDEAAESGERVKPVEGGNGCMTLMQLASPTISAPPDLNIAQIGEAFLQFLGMTPEDAARFSANTDWATTLVIPLPRSGTRYREVQVDGVTGTLIERPLEHHKPFFILLWVKNDVVYALTGPGNGEAALPIANSLQ